MACTPLPIVAPGCGGATITSMQAVQLTTSTSHNYQRIFNAGPGTLWCTRDPLATPAVQGPSCFTILPGQAEEYPLAGSAYVPRLATFAVADTTCSVAVEVA